MTSLEVFNEGKKAFVAITHTWLLLPLEVTSRSVRLANGSVLIRA